MSSAPGGLVFLHGYDDVPETWDDPASALSHDGWIVRAPPGPLMTPAGRRCWFETDERTGPDPGQVTRALDAVGAAIDAVVTAGVPRAQIALAGFSQGAALALLWARTTKDAPVGALVLIAGWVPDVEGYDPFAVDTVAAEHVLVAHGAHDETVPLPLGRSAAKLLGRDGADVTFVELDVGHDPRPFIAGARSFLERR